VNLAQKQVLIVGGGVAGLSAAAGLARLDCRVSLVEKGPRLGGHAARLACKAAPDCVRCGACAVEERLQGVLGESRITVHTGARLLACSGPPPCSVTLAQGAGAPRTLQADAIVVASGFAPFAPAAKPYGWGRLADVVTSLELECALRRDGGARRPSDGKPPQNVAFVQCVGSRDLGLGHPFCSRVCCASALRMAHLVQHRRPATEVTVFHLDIQSFGRDFDPFYGRMRRQVRLVRAIPADILDNGGGRLTVTFFDPAAGAAAEEPFDLVCLSVGLLPGEDTAGLASLLGLDIDPDGFLAAGSARGVFLAGTAAGPMGIAESIAAADRAVGQVAAFLGGQR
jgi:heterodisulfide reductase subunit A